jgi:hypothetical protein
LGDLDVLGEITAGGGYEALITHSAPVAAFGLRIACLDLEAVAELEALFEERQRGGGAEEPKP